MADPLFRVNAIVPALDVSGYNARFGITDISRSPGVSGLLTGLRGEFQIRSPHWSGHNIAKPTKTFF